eukprot:1499596-Prorocentrum_lima.AAC.1
MCIRDRGQTHDNQGRYWNNHTNQDEIALYQMYWHQGWLQETHPVLEEGWIVNAYGERVRVNLLWQRRAIGSVEDELRKAIRNANWSHAQRLVQGALRCA